MRSDQHPATTDADEVVMVPRARLDALVARVETLERRLGGPASPPPEPAAPADAREAPGVGRRRALIGLAGAVAAGTAAALAPGSPVAADDGDPVLLGSANIATSSTNITASGSADTVTATSVGGTALVGHSSSGSGGFFTTSAADTPALLAAGLGVGVQAAGARGQAALTPEVASPLTFAHESRTGTLYMQAAQDEETFFDGTLWLCVADGTPGTWRKVAAHNTAGAYHPLPAPVRAYDSRPGTLPSQGPKTPLPAGNISRTIDLKHNGTTVPSGALSAVVTVLLVNATSGAGNFTIWANDRPKPASNTLVWGGDAGRFTTLATTSLDSLARVKIDASLQTHVVLDVVGFYR